VARATGVWRCGPVLWWKPPEQGLCVGDTLAFTVDQIIGLPLKAMVGLECRQFCQLRL